MVAAGAEAAPPGDVRVPTATGHREITGREAEAYHAANAWLELRLKEAESIRVESGYADVVKLFRGDGGIATPTKHRFVLILCPFLKVNVEFEDKPGVKARHPVPATARWPTASSLPTASPASPTRSKPCRWRSAAATRA